MKTFQRLQWHYVGVHSIILPLARESRYPAFGSSAPQSELTCYSHVYTGPENRPMAKHGKLRFFSSVRPT